MPENPLTIDVLFTRACPHVTETKREVMRALEGKGVRGILRVHEITSDEEARERGFTGSPTVFVNGKDVVGNATGEAPTAHACRDYVGEGGHILPYPPAEVVEQAITDALSGPGGIGRM